MPGSINPNQRIIANLTQGDIKGDKRRPELNLEDASKNLITTSFNLNSQSNTSGISNLAKAMLAIAADVNIQWPKWKKPPTDADVINCIGLFIHN